MWLSDFYFVKLTGVIFINKAQNQTATFEPSNEIEKYSKCRAEKIARS